MRGNAHAVPDRAWAGGLRVSRLAVGTVQFGMDYGFNRAKSQAQVDEILECCLRRGVNLLDTARSYGDSEEKIGNFLGRRPGHGFVVATKLRKIDESEAADGEKLAAAIRASLDASRKALRLDRIPLLQLHQADPFLLRNDRFWEALLRIKEQGAFQLLGVSLYDVSEARMLAGLPQGRVHFIQAPYNVLDQRFQDAASELRATGIKVMVRSVFLKGVITIAQERVPKWLSGILPFKRRLQQLAEQSGLSLHELALLFALHADFADSVLLGLDGVEELERNIETLEKMERLKPIAAELKDLDVPDRSLTDPRNWPESVFSP